MSLALNFTHSSGVVITFWTLNSISVDAYGHLGTILMDGWLDSSSKGSGYSPVTSVYISVTFNPTTVVPNITVLQALYAKIALDSFFTGATYTDDGL